MSDTCDEIIMNEVKGGNLAGMSEIFERYHTKMYNFFLKLTFNPEISQDLTQNLFYRMIRYRQSFRDELNFRSWIYQMARNLYADYYRQEKRSSGMFLNSPLLTKDVEEENESFTEDDYIKLEKAMLLLPENLRELLVLSRYQGLKYEEISVITGQSLPAVKVAIHRAIKQLRGNFFKHKFNTNYEV